MSIDDDIIDEDTDEDELTFRHIQVEDGDTVDIPEDIHRNNIEIKLDDDGQAHLLWIEGDDTRVV